MTRLRAIVFWLHLAVGLAAGAVIGVMALTGAALAFRGPMTAWAERDVRRVAVPAGAPRPLPLRALVEAVRRARPDARPAMLTLSRDPQAAVQFGLGRGDFAFVNPYTGEVRAPADARLREFLETMERVHRWLGLSGRWQRVGLLATISACGAFSLLLLSGLFLWWPRRWSWKAFARAARPRFDQAGKARDRNWHTAAGFWLAPLILLSTGTGLTMAYSRLGGIVSGPSRPERRELPAPAPAKSPGRPLGLEAVVQRTEAARPRWTTLTVRLEGAGGNRRRPPGSGADSAARRTGENLRQPIVVSVRESGTWPALPVQVGLDPLSGEILLSRDPARLAWPQRLAASARSFHVGEALGPAGPFLMAIGALGALGLVLTGFALAARRFFGAGLGLAAPARRVAGRETANGGATGEPGEAPSSELPRGRGARRAEGDSVCRPGIS